METNHGETDRESHNVNPDPSNPNSDPSSLSIPEIQYAMNEAIPIKESRHAWWESVNLSKISLFIISVYLFILAITLMKDGARGIGPLIQNILSITSPGNSLGFGWLSAYLVMSGSPVAASALTFYQTGAINELGAYAMIAGSRLGANFIVLFIGFIYVLRGRDRATSLSMGLLSLIVTATTYFPSYFLGAYMLETGIFDNLQIQSGALLQSFFDSAIYPISNLASDYITEWVVFIIGLGIIMFSFSLFDKCLPQMTLKESQVGHMSRLVYHPLVMFSLGALITMISMSVSLSLSILVPLSNRGFVRRENVIPYIMGANITTFIDTLFAAALLDSPPAFTIVLVAMLSIAVVSIATLIFAHRSYQHMSLYIVEKITSNNFNLFLFMIALFVIPVILIGFA